MIQLDDDWRLRPDTAQWTLEKNTGRKDEDGEEIWVPKGYYQMLSQALIGYTNKAIKTSRSVEGLMKKITEFREKLTELHPVKPEKTEAEPDADTDFLD